jgi:hypothetical protein
MFQLKLEHPQTAMGYLGFKTGKINVVNPIEVTRLFYLSAFFPRVKKNSLLFLLYLSKGIFPYLFKQCMVQGQLCNSGISFGHSVG